MNIYSKVKNSLREKAKEIKDVVKEMDKLEDYKKNGHLDPDYIRNVIDPQIHELRLKVARMKDSALGDIQKLVDEQKGILRKKNQINGAELTDDAKLFTCGVRLTDREIEDLIDRNGDNPTMIQLALRYAQDNGIKVNRVYNNHTVEIRECDNFYESAKIYVSHWIDMKNADEMLDKFYPEAE